MGETASPVIEVFADVWCPFTHVGLHAVDEHRRRTGRADVAIVVRAWPLELVNGAPLDPAAALAHAVELRDQVAPGLFAGIGSGRFPSSTLEPLALAARAYRTGPRAGERVSFALRDALFEEGLDVSDPAVLEQIAEGAGVAMPDDADRAAVLDDWAEGRRRGVQGSPHFFCGDVEAFCPSLRITKDPVHGASIEMDRSRLTEFLDRCFGPAPPGEAPPGEA